MLCTQPTSPTKGVDVHLENNNWLNSQPAPLSPTDNIQGIMIGGLCPKSDYYKRLLKFEGSSHVIDNNNNEKVPPHRTGKVGLGDMNRPPAALQTGYSLERWMMYLLF